MMKRFIIRAAALLLIFAALIYAAGALYRGTDGWAGLEATEETYKFHDVPDGITLAAAGSSHGIAAFRTSDLGEGFFNFSMSAQTPQYDLMMLRSVAGHIEDGATVILTVSYMSPFWTDTEETFATKQNRYYRILPPDGIVDADLVRWCLGRFSPALTTDAKDIARALLAPRSAPADPDAVWTEGSVTEDMIPAERERVARDHLTLITPAMPDGNPVMLASYGDILALCRERGWKPVLVTPPYPREYTECFPDDVLAAFRSLMTELARENGVEWLDHSCDEGYPLAYFRDLDHLNEEGAHAFSAVLLAELAELGLR